MIKKEWKKLCKNPLLLIVMAAIILIPSIYSTLFLASMWDPYGNLDSLPVAIVNQDKSVEYKGRTLSVGDELVDNLKDNNSLDFHFVDKDEADEGIKSGKYYMVITIPDDFSANASTLMDDNPKQMKLDYAINPGTNYIASKLSSSALVKIENTIADEVTRTYADSMFAQLSEIGDGLEDGADGAGRIYDGTNELLDGNSRISENLRVLANSTLSFSDGSRTLKNGLVDYTDGVDKLAGGAVELKEGTTKLVAGSRELVNGTVELDKGADDLKSGALELVSGVNTLSGGSKELYSGIITLDSGAVELNTGAKTLSNGMLQLKQGSSRIVDGAVEFDNKLNLYVDNVEMLSQGIAALAMAAPDNVQLQQLKAGADALVANNALLRGAAATLKGGVTELDTNIATLNQGAAKLYTGSDSLVTGSHKLVAGADKLDSGVVKLSSGSGKLLKGTMDLKDGAAKLAGGAKELDAGIVKVDEGVATLKDGASALNANNTKLLEGVDALTDGANRLNDGANQLAEGSDRLQNGLIDLKNGSLELSGALSDGVGEIRKNAASDSTLDMFSTPVVANETVIAEVPNNGSAMSAYMMCVGLWVGALAFCLMYPLTEYEGELKNGFAWWASKATVAYPLAIIMAGVMLMALHIFCGFDPLALGKTLLIACVAACTFMSIMYFFNVALGKVGSFAMLVFMVVQLAGSAGTYPIELSASFVARIHKYLPFSYVVEAFRMGICGAGDITNSIVVLLIWMLVFTALTIALFLYRGKKLQAGKENLYDKLEKAGLA